ncbi:cobalamin-dependent protein [Eubacteriaceae bacterium ES3]|nr:cobalamin-dependent protein [Eubacteriaceae bacterium ES3]
MEDRRLFEVLMDGDSRESMRLASELLAEGISRETIIVEGIEAAMSELDEKCTLEKFNLLEIMLVGRAVTEVMKVLYPEESQIVYSKDTIILVTLEGDVHDLGKGIVKTVLMANGYRVVDCGKNCPVDELLKTVEAEKPLAVGVSGLIFTGIEMVKSLRELLNGRGMDAVGLIAGGAAFKQLDPETLNVDYVAQTAFDATHFLTQMKVGCSYD